MTTHFLTHDAETYYRGRARVQRALCERFVRVDNGYKLREAALVTCPTCMVVKDAWLESGAKKPLTVRRLRALMKAKP